MIKLIVRYLIMATKDKTRTISIDNGTGNIIIETNHFIVDQFGQVSRKIRRFETPKYIFTEDGQVIDKEKAKRKVEAEQERHSFDIHKFLKTATETEFQSRNADVDIKVSKGDPNSFANPKDAPFIIKVNRSIGANSAKDKSFARHLKSIFGSKAVKHGAERTNRYNEEATFIVSGNVTELKLKKDIHTHKQQRRFS